MVLRLYQDPGANFASPENPPKAEHELTSPHFETLKALLENNAAVVGVIGLGYVGVPLALAICEAGYRVVGFDINPDRVGDINDGKQVISYLGAEEISRARASGRFEATDDQSRLGEADALIICVPTPLSADREPNLSYIEATASSIAKTLRPGQLIILESTTWPGTTKEVVQPLLEQTGQKLGQDFFLAFSPEREDPANAQYTTKSIPKIVGADEAQSFELAVELYQKIVKQVVAVNGTATAEAVKLTENIFRAVNIALVNELKLVYEAMDIDVWEVVEAAATKPFGFMPFYPGPGLGGHCVPIDPFYLTWRARKFGVDSKFIELAGEINTHMPTYVTNRLADELERSSGKSLNGARILLFGVAYKANVNDTRESPSLKLMEIIEDRGATCDFHDPHIEEIPATRDHPTLTGRLSVSLNDGILADYDAAIVATDHDDLDYAMIASNANLIIDTRNVFARLGLSDQHIKKA